MPVDIIGIQGELLGVVGIRKSPLLAPDARNGEPDWDGYPVTFLTANLTAKKPEPKSVPALVLAGCPDKLVRHRTQDPSAQYFGTIL
jgi:hypothetical protein